MSDERTLEEQCYGVCYAAKERIAELEAGNAAELRRLHAVNAALLKALKAYEAWADPTICRDAELRAIRIQIRAAIAKAEGVI